MSQRFKVIIFDLNLVFVCWSGIAFMFYWQKIFWDWDHSDQVVQSLIFDPEEWVSVELIFNIDNHQIPALIHCCSCHHHGHKNISDLRLCLCEREIKIKIQKHIDTERLLIHLSQRWSQMSENKQEKAVIPLLLCGLSLISILDLYQIPAMILIMRGCWLQLPVTMFPVVTSGDQSQEWRPCHHWPLSHVSDRDHDCWSWISLSSSRFLSPINEMGQHHHQALCINDAKYLQHPRNKVIKKCNKQILKFIVMIFFPALSQLPLQFQRHGKKLLSLNSPSKLFLFSSSLSLPTQFFIQR